MAAIVITCPVTKKDVRTGFEMDRKSFESVALNNNNVRCPHCKDVHTWSKQDARLEEGNG